MITLINNTIQIDLEDGSTFILKPVKWISLDDAIALQKKLLNEVFDKNASIGQILRPSNQKFWRPAKDLIKLTPIVGDDFKLEKIDNVEDIIRLFISDPYGLEDESGYLNTLNPSLFAKLNSLDFYEMRKEVMESRQVEA